MSQNCHDHIYHCFLHLSVSPTDFSWFWIGDYCSFCYIYNICSVGVVQTSLPMLLKNIFVDLLLECYKICLFWDICVPSFLQVFPLLQIMYHLQIFKQSHVSMLCWNALQTAIWKIPVGSFEWTYFCCLLVGEIFLLVNPKLGTVQLCCLINLELDTFQRKGRFPDISKYSITLECK